MNWQTELRQDITRRIVAALQNGTAPWRRPWRTDLTNSGPPANALSGKPYRGINSVLLGLAGYESRWWATFAQVQALGLRVRKGEHATKIVFWRQVERTVANGADVEAFETYPLLKSYFVFNLQQCEGPGVEDFLAVPCTPIPFEDFGPAEQVIAATGADIRHGGDRAFYDPQDDYIQMPQRQAFESRAAYYGTLAHEACHWTGHENRLDRLNKLARFGNEAYAVEELVASLGSSFLCNEVGVTQAEDLSNEAAYLSAWLNILQADATAIFTASSQASRAVDFILSFSRQDQGASEDHGAAAGVV
jgi:antirestriction protein ArdC